MSQRERGLLSEQPVLLCQKWRETLKGGEGRGGGHLLGNRAWAWDIRTSLWGTRLGWMAWVGPRDGLWTWTMPGRVGWAAPHRAWPRATVPTTYWPVAALPEEATADPVVPVAGEVVWAF